MTAPVVIIGAGPAGLMAAEVLSTAGHMVHVYDAMPAPGRKFLRAGVGGLNLTKAQDFDAFVAAYGAAQNWLKPYLKTFGPDHVRAWADDLGAETFVGSSGKVFPKIMKAAPLLRAWLHRLDTQGVKLHPRHFWQGWTSDGALLFSAPDGDVSVIPAATILALGGASWPRLGTTGDWVQHLQNRNVACAPWQPSNCGFHVNWSSFFQDRFAGTPLPTVNLTFGERTVRAPLILSAYGIEGHGVYALSAALRDAIQNDGSATLFVDLAPDRSHADITKRLAKPRGSKSFASHLKRTMGLDGARAALLREALEDVATLSPSDLAALIKAVPVTCLAPRPLTEAISVAGGIALDEMDSSLQLHKAPGIYCAGEMLDWEAPTGGYLLTACLSLGYAAGHALHTHLSS